MKQIRMLLILTMVLCFLFTCNNALAAEIARGQVSTINLQKSKIIVSKTNQYTPNRPILIFFPGAGQCTDTQEALNWVRYNHLYDDLDVDVIICQFSSKWERSAEDLYDFLYPYQNAIDDDEELTIIIDAFSFGGYGGCCAALYLSQMGMQVKELNIADGCRPEYVNANLLQRILDVGVKLNIYGRRSSGEPSKTTCKMIDAMNGAEGFYGEVLDTSHAGVLKLAIQRGLHSEYQYGYVASSTTDSEPIKATETVVQTQQSDSEYPTTFIVLGPRT